MSDASLPSEQPGTQAFPIIVSATPAEPPSATELAIHDPSQAFALASELSRDQQRVLEQLAQGHGVVQASRTTGVPRRTIGRWVNHDPKFIAALNAWKNEQLESGRASAFAMADVVMAALRSGIEKGNTNIAFRMALQMGLLNSKPGPIDAGEVERRQQIRGARVDDELSQAEHEHNLDLDDRAQRQGIAWASWVPRGLTCDEHALLKFLRDKASGHTSAALILYSKRRMFDMLRQGGVKEDEAMQLLANYRRPYPGFYAPNDLPYAEDEEKSKAVVADAPKHPAKTQVEQDPSRDSKRHIAEPSR